MSRWLIFIAWIMAGIATVVSLGDTNIHHLHLCELSCKFPVNYLANSRTLCGAAPIIFGRCCTVLWCGSCVWLDIWTGICKSLAAALQVGYNGCAGQVLGLVGEEICWTRLEVAECWMEPCFFCNKIQLFMFMFNSKCLLRWMLFVFQYGLSKILFRYWTDVMKNAVRVLS